MKETTSYLRDTLDELKDRKIILSDEKTKMGLIQEIKLELRKAGALKLNYSSRKGVTNSRY